jgi:hypothetical protein
MQNDHMVVNLITENHKRDVMNCNVNKQIQQNSNKKDNFDGNITP